jgi:hypothetical protein
MKLSIYNFYALSHVLFLILSLIYIQLINLSGLITGITLTLSIVTCLLTHYHKNKNMIVVNGMIYVFSIGLYLIEAIANQELRLFKLIIIVSGLIALFSAKHFLENKSV